QAGPRAQRRTNRAPWDSTGTEATPRRCSGPTSRFPRRRRGAPPRHTGPGAGTAAAAGTGPARAGRPRPRAARGRPARRAPRHAERGRPAGRAPARAWPSGRRPGEAVGAPVVLPARLRPGVAARRVFAECEGADTAAVHAGLDHRVADGLHTPIAELLVV